MKRKCKYAELKIDVIDEQDGLEGKKVQTGSGIDEDYEGDTDEEAVDEEDEEYEGNTDEEAVDEEEDTVEDMDDDKGKSDCNGCLKERFFDFIFEAEEFISSDFHQKMLHYEKIFRDDITNTIEKDKNNEPKDVDEVIDDVEHLCNEFDKEGNTCFKYCSKRKINSVSEMVGVLLNKRIADYVKKANPSKFRYIQALLQPYRKSLRKLKDPYVDIH